MSNRGRPNKPKQVNPEAAGIPTCPSCLTSRGKAEWRRVAEELNGMGLLAKVDRAALTAYCEAWEDFTDLLEQYRNEGATVTTDKGNVVQHPILGAKNKAADRLVKIAAQFGMTPAARSKIEIEEKKAADDFANFAGLKVVN